MKNRVIKLNEKSLESLVNKIIKEEKIQEALPRRERERHQTNWRKREFEPYDREKDIMGAFGPYSSDVPPNVISYLRKNPRTFLQRVVDIYGMDKVLDFIGYQQPEMTESYGNYMEEDIEMLQDSAYSLGYHLSDELADLVEDNEDKLQLIVDNFNLALEESLTDSLGINVKASVIMDEGYDNYMDDFHESRKKNQKNKKLTLSDIKSKMDSLESSDRHSNLRNYR